MTPQRDAGKAEATGRMAKARQFADAAELFRDDALASAVDVGDAFVTLAVHAGIAAADVICISRLGAYSPTGNHAESVGLLKKADASVSIHLDRLLGMKTKAGYATRPVSAREVQQAASALEALLDRARELHRP